jgi:hypothetical protein
MTVAREVIAGVAVAGVLAAASIACAGNVSADPSPPLPADPAVPAPLAPPGPPVPLLGAPLGPSGLSPMAQSGVPAVGPFGLPQAPTDELLLGQRSAPSAPGGAPGTPPILNSLNNSYLLPQNEVPSAPGTGQIFDVAPGQENADISHTDYLKRVWHLYQDGRLKGSLLGQVPQEQLGAPLPGTAPPPGTNIPPGLTPPEPAPPAAPVLSNPMSVPPA